MRCSECDDREATARTAQQELQQLRLSLESQKAEARLALDAARDKAFAEGVIKGREEAATEFGARSRALVDAVNALQAEHGQWMRELDETSAVLIYTAVVRIIGEVLVDERDRARVILGRIQEQPGTELALRVSPADLGAVREALMHGGIEAMVTADESMMPGSCSVRTELGELDARLDRQMEQLKAVLCAAVRGGN
jgi:flagellar biosynthesis/type III secretory pathway protein FliH